MKIIAYDDNSEFHGTESFKKCAEFIIDTPCDTNLEENEELEEEIDTALIKLLETILGYRFDEDSWYFFDWRDDQTVWIHYNEPYPARRLPL